MKHRGECIIGLSRCIACNKLVRQPFDGRCKRCFTQRGGLVIEYVDDLAPRKPKRGRTR